MTRFRTFNEMVEQLGEVGVLKIVTMYLDAREKRTEYNKTRNRIAATVLANPELKKMIMEGIKTA